MLTSKNNDLQCLRAVAIILVMMQHYRNRLPTPDAYSRLFEHFSFWTGVDIFFAISGLLICHSFLRDLRHSASIKQASIAFWVRRLGRLFPAVVFWVAISVCVAAIASHSAGADPRKAAVSGAAALLGVSNAYWSYCVQHQIAACGSADFNGVTWSLSLEWQLYATLMLLIVAVGRKWAVGLMLIAAIIMSAFPAPSFSIAWAFRMQAFALGAATFLVLGKGGSLPKLSLHPVACITMLMLGVLVCASSPTHLPQPFVLPAAAAGALLCLVSALSGNSYSRYRIVAPLIWIGERSYSIYLCHLPIFLVTNEVLVRSIGLQADLGHIVIGLAIATTSIAICSDLSYRFIEAPFQRFVQYRLTRARQTNGVNLEITSPQ
ncbi:acyltransferase family protein [Paraburkholderia diazotrophica]|uniref:Peptidoglycan/LPS O-acetylase OafA/YrhL, contains acyltransferase and SGNH-hydrolase domains n=1 Tax=Paraburkholderia diazotrophica TaxID=667676 RepID=A0A1H7DZN1_9BURK|nr:acyltransferase [Paraburkholderia diazotrophica]SEK05142.1 Peptidoglycan/LPS O-acetylase OafA/YrhL, contains acyltransferase and SGNH-hydrolase domains [Paraburkholderia diazotrophica]